MLILLYGQDTYRSRQKLKEIIEQYKKIHQSGLNLTRFSLKNGISFNFEKIREIIEAVSMFNEKKLIILEDAFGNKDFQEVFLKYVKKNKFKKNKDVIVVIYEKGKFPVSGFKSQVNMIQEFKSLEGANLVKWIENEVKKQGGEIDKSSAQKLAFYVGDDLWQMNQEITKLIHYQSKITSGSVDLLVNPKIETDIFKTIDALAMRDKRTALMLLYKHLEQGEKEFYLLTMLAYQFRNLIKLKSLVERNIPYYALTQKTKIHPFVVKKTWEQLRNFNLNELKNIYRKLLEAETETKKGRLEIRAALDLLITEI
ncbi:MAG: DNA polymerase III subunit delta [Candidatus Portnoybacteria bacterium RIFCSPLOWO2_01_FULL_43_11]|uniref:DNA-directed DNA polymerase n=4 Tax=Candidatus Portnoyibacteriota TaxID=1817913 RepID=A0A1G2FEG5_9BACT|nr:MAG: DNA polymerase III subunit delta [Candidatus Portnoybacteria bacterium RIFCSPHIGHO2_01_FULL_40_12b]OGZ37439.1 MAG: DNA polymerase III subunit delta [Candidatus Portnoybacteria bacterium RIFCSPHIGHO2_02_FULL_40_23]OGZ37976.1 MAG: DNA polymerase III subunit delta [Candidatus Portnoybacteria bacterium RIFCSPHIGHO2_12_FULL_40_11]OGZ38152.1 MAG: DNA polymerase III subunit delta [Candidatus Portnoybacteria bacterium RIFCSPLOWO2_01_FULL_43_11]OGZ40320.1 MAG: DNA polymerase III subunit delta [C